MDFYTAVGVLFILLSTKQFPSFVNAACTGNARICEWVPWDSWSDCSRQCAGGTRYRDRRFCCKLSLVHDIRLCMDDCGWDYDVARYGFSDSEKCNTFCANGGTYVFNGYCRCPDRYTGTCCRDVVTCGRPNTISHGSFSGSDFTYAGQVKYVCDTGYNMTDPSQAVRTCTKSGYWSGSSPLCLYAVSCNSSPCENRAHCINLLGNYRCVCTTGWTGKNCNVDIQPPVVSGCPADRNILTSNLTNIQSWIEPNITDPHGTKVHITKNYVKSSYEFPWGEFTILYTGVKPSNGLRAECKFNITVKPFPCEEMYPPANGILMCNGWRTEYSQVCIFSCKVNYAFQPGFRKSDIYVCGASGHWLPPKSALQCISKDLFANSEDENFSTCTRSSDKQALAEFYIQQLKASPFNALCVMHPGDCIYENVKITC